MERQTRRLQSEQRDERRLKKLPLQAGRSLVSQPFAGLHSLRL